MPSSKVRVLHFLAEIESPGFRLDMTKICQLKKKISDRIEKRKKMRQEQLIIRRQREKERREREKVISQNLQNFWNFL